MPWSSIVTIEILLLLFRLLVITLLSPKVSSLFLFKLRGCTKNWFAFVYVLTSYISFAIIVLRINIICRWDKHNSASRSNIRRREIIPQTGSIRSKFLKAKHLIKLCTGSPLQFSSDLWQFCFKLLVFFAKKLFSNRSAPMVWLDLSNFMESSSQSSSTSLSFLVANLYNFSCFSKNLYNFS